MKQNHLTFISLLLSSAFIGLPLTGYAATSHDGNRWFQIEISIFSHEGSSDREEELWTAKDLDFGSLASARRLDQIHEFFQVRDFDEQVNGIPTDPADAFASIQSTIESTTQSATQPSSQPTTDSQLDLNPDAVQNELPQSGPFSYQHNADLKFFDFSRDSFLQLPNSESQFSQTNRAIERSPGHRLLFHGLWRQPVQNTAAATTLYVDGGEQYDGQHELQGTVTIRFNPNQDRVVIDADLLFAEFGRLETDDIEWSLPELPGHLKEVVPEQDNSDSVPAFQNLDQQRFNRGSSNGNSVQALTEGVTRIFQLKQSRDMRSEEFHYLDHPALGLVIMVNPYDLPLPESELDGLEDFPEEPLLPNQQ